MPGFLARHLSRTNWQFTHPAVMLCRRRSKPRLPVGGKPHVDHSRACATGVQRSDSPRGLNGRRGSARRQLAERAGGGATQSLRGGPKSRTAGLGNRRIRFW
jgi:hypothetical protein